MVDREGNGDVYQPCLSTQCCVVKETSKHLRKSVSLIYNFVKMYCNEIGNENEILTNIAMHFLRR